MFLWFENLEARVRERSDYVLNIANQLNANYRYGLKKIKDKFNIVENYENTYCNAIFGLIEGYDYCFYEYFHCARGRAMGLPYINNYFISEEAIKLKGYCSSFVLLTKKSAIWKTIKYFLVGEILLSFLLFLLTFSHEKKNIELVGIFIVGIFMFYCLINFILDLYKINTNYKVQEKYYDISNKDFKDKYVIISSYYPISLCSDNINIKKVFTEKVCSRIVDSKLNSDIVVVNSCIREKYEKKLTYDICQKHLNNLLSKAKLFER